MGELSQETDLLVVGAGPGGCAAALRAAALGLDVTLVDDAEIPGGGGLRRGCVPSRAFARLAGILNDVRRLGRAGVGFGPPALDLEKLRSWSADGLRERAAALGRLADRRGVQRLRGRAVFTGPDSARLQGAGVGRVTFKNAVVATGSEPKAFPGLPREDYGRVAGVTEALSPRAIPAALLVVGGGVEGVELAGVYRALGSRVTLVEARDRLLSGVDGDLVRVLYRQIRERLEGIRLDTRVSELRAGAEKVEVRMEKGGKAVEAAFDQVFLAIGRSPRTSGIGLKAAGVETDGKGYILVDERRRTTNPRVYAAGDVVGPDMLAHKAVREGRVAAEAVAGGSSSFDARAVPTVVYTDPPVAWAGVTEAEARRNDWKIDVRRFHWPAFPEGAAPGLTKLVLAPDSGRVLGVGIVGRGADLLICEGVLAVEMGASAEDLALSVHPRHNLPQSDAELDALFLGGAEGGFRLEP